MYNVRVSELSLYARAWHHAKSVYRTIKPIDKADPFLIGLGQYQRFGISIIEQHLANLRKKEADERRILEPNRRCQITRNILESLDDGVSHLYIVGTPGMGKTEIIDWFLRGKKYWKAGEPSNFLFGTLTDKVDYVWFEDFDLMKYTGHLNSLLSLMDHKETTISRKGVDDRTIICPARFIYISNYQIPCDYPMFKRRVKIIEVEHQVYNCQCANDTQSTSHSAGASEGLTVDELLGRDIFNDIFL